MNKSNESRSSYRQRTDLTINSGTADWIFFLSEVGTEKLDQYEHQIVLKVPFFFVCASLIYFPTFKNENEKRQIWEIPSQLNFPGPAKNGNKMKEIRHFARDRHTKRWIWQSWDVSSPLECVMKMTSLLQKAFNSRPKLRLVFDSYKSGLRPHQTWA